MQKKKGRRPPPRQYHHGDLRRALIDAALAIVSGEGVAALTLREVARAAGVSHAAPYHHFADKAAILAAVAEEGFRALHAALSDDAVSRERDPVERLRHQGVAYVRFAAAHPSHFRVMFGSREFDWSDYPSLSEAATVAFGDLFGSVTACIEAGHAHGDDPTLAALTAWSLVHGLSALWIDGPVRWMPFGPGTTAESLAEQVTAIFLRTRQ